jgi:hypothetical protein
VHPLAFLGYRPLTIIIIAGFAENTSGNVAQIMGKIIIEICAKKLLTKMLVVWYN